MLFHRHLLVNECIERVFLRGEGPLFGAPRKTHVHDVALLLLQLLLPLQNLLRVPYHRQVTPVHSSKLLAHVLSKLRSVLVERNHASLRLPT